MNSTKNNHFVPQYYLKKFLNNDKYICKCDLDNNSKIYMTQNPEKECCKRIYIL